MLESKEPGVAGKAPKGGDLRVVSGVGVVELGNAHLFGVVTMYKTWWSKHITITKDMQGLETFVTLFTLFTL